MLSYKYTNNNISKEKKKIVMTYKLAYIIIVVVVAINDTINAQNNISPFIMIMHEISPIKKEKKKKRWMRKNFIKQ